jgi:hypothetical protein
MQSSKLCIKVLLWPCPHRRPPHRAVKPISECRLRAQRANAQLSTGPRTAAGRRRSARNRLGLKRGGLFGWGGLDPVRYGDVLRVWRDLAALFWFVKPALWFEEPRLKNALQDAGLAWSAKLRAARQGFFSDRLNNDIHSHLSEFLFEFRLHNRKCDDWLRKEFGTDGAGDINSLRQAIERRLSSFREWPRLVEKANMERKGPPPPPGRFV